MTKNTVTHSAESILQHSKTPQHLVIPSVASSSTSETLQIDTLPVAFEVAKYVIQLGAAEDEPEFLTHMRLQKLLYYAQGWSLAIRDRQLFNDRIEAWAHGPVVTEVYKHFSNVGDQPILPQQLTSTSTLTKEDRAFVTAVWNAYKVHSAASLRSMTHAEEPWINARRGYAPADRCSVEIAKDALKQFFTKALNRGKTR